MNARRARRLAALGLAVALPVSGCAQFATPVGPQSPNFPNIGYSTFGPNEPDYRLYPGDVLDVTFPSAPELNRQVTVGQDGRIDLPLVPPVMAADLSTPALSGLLAQTYAPLLVRPEVDVSIRTSTPLRIFVGGEVQKPGVYDMPGDIDALQAVVMAGGFNPDAKLREVILIRRGAAGQPLMRLVDLRAAALDPVRSDSVPLRRFDVIYVPKTAIGNADTFVQQYIRDLVPVSFSYALGGGFYGVTP